MRTPPPRNFEKATLYLSIRLILEFTTVVSIMSWKQSHGVNAWRFLAWAAIQRLRHGLGRDTALLRRLGKLFRSCSRPYLPEKRGPSLLSPSINVRTDCQ